MVPKLNLHGRTALITGAGRGIGRSIALRFAEAGADIVVCARTESEIEEVAGEAREFGGRAYPVVTDLSSVSEMERLLDAVKDEFGAADVLVNNAGINSPGTMRGRDPAEIDSMLFVNLRSVFILSRLFGQSFDQSSPADSGTVINIASIYAHVGVPSRTFYGATKAGVVGISRGLAIELAPENITVNSVSPGRILVDRIRDLDKPEREDGKMEKEKIPLGRFGRPSEIANVCLFLASDFGSYITGEDIRVDGGVGITAAPYPIT